MTAQNILLGFLAFMFLCLLFFCRMLWLTIQRRKRILQEGPMVNATVTHCDEIYTKGGRLNRSWMVFKTLEGKTAEVVQLMPKNKKIYPVGLVVPLQYDPLKPTRFIIVGGEHGRWLGIGIIIFGIVITSASLIGFYFVYRTYF